MRGLIVAAALTVLCAGVRAQEAPGLLERASQNRAKGVAGAPVMVYEVADFQCPYCGQFARDVMARIDSAYIKPGKVQWIFVNLPLPNHGNAWVAAEAALCAGAVAERFWPVHDLLFRHQAEWAMIKDPAVVLDRLAREAGVPAEPYQACVRDDRMAPLILQDVIFAATSRINGTPAFIINNEQMVVGLKSYEEWRELLDAAVKKKGGG